MMEKQKRTLLLAGIVVIVCLGLIIFNEPIKDVLSQAKPTQPGAWQRIEGQESFVDPLTTITFPAMTPGVAPTGIYYDRMYIPGGTIRTSLWREVIDGVVYDVATLVNREDDSQSYLQIIDTGALIIRNLVPVPGNLGELKILRREGNFLVIEVLGTGAILKFDFIQQKLYDSSKNVLAEVIETEVPTQLSPTATPTPAPIPYP